MIIEICANSVQSAVIAQESGAQRIELCCNLEQGGLTPSPGTMELARKWLAIEVFVLIRPRIGDFCYSDIEMETKLKNILFCKELQMDGVVFGMLNKDKTIDIERNKILLEAARPMKVTFHRAYDCVPHPSEGLEQLVELGFDRVLTSGQANTAVQGQETIRQLVQQAANRIIILPGSGLNTKNIKNFVEFTKVKEVHLSAKHAIPSGEGGLFAANYLQTSPDLLRKIVGLFDLA